MFAKTSIILVAFAAAFAQANPTPASDPITPAQLNKRVTHTGRGTIYEQEGATGSCGVKNSDSTIIAALSNYWMDGESPGPYCGRKIKATNTGSNDGVGGAGNTVDVLVQDTCESCGEGDVDFSVGAWNELTNGAAFGTFDVSWNFCNADGQC